MDDKTPCPFCASTVLMYTTFLDKDGNRTGWTQVHCNSCGASGPRATSKEEADQKWNDRKGG